MLNDIYLVTITSKDSLSKTYTFLNKSSALKFAFKHARQHIQPIKYSKRVIIYYLIAVKIL